MNDYRAVPVLLPTVARKQVSTLPEKHFTKGTSCIYHEMSVVSVLANRSRGFEPRMTRREASLILELSCGPLSIFLSLCVCVCVGG